MNLQQARSILGTDVESDPDTIRRAYLRAVKRHPPERDPDGFREVREAFELLRRVLVSPAPASPVQGLMHQYWTAEDEESRESIFEQLRTEHTDDPEVRWLEYDRADPEEVPDVARRSGDPHMLRAAMLASPDAFADEELVAFVESDPGLDPLLIRLLMGRELRGAAIAYARRERDHTASGLSAALELIASGAVEEGRGLLGAWMARERELVPRRFGNMPLEILLGQELLALPETFPSSVFRKLARGLRDFDVPPVEELLEGLDRRRRGQALRQLNAHGPQLVHHVGQSVDNGRGPVDAALGRVKRRGPTMASSIPWIVVVLLGLSHLLFSSSRPSPPRFDPSRFRPVVAPAPPSSLSFAEKTAETACLRSLASCEEYRAAAEAMDSGRCDAAADHLYFAATTDPLEQTLIETMEQELRRVCSASEPAMSPPPDPSAD